MKANKIIIVGMGGQGAQTIAKILASSAAQNGLAASYIPLFGVEQRGVPSTAFIAINTTKIRYPLFNGAELAIILHPKAIAFASAYIYKKTKIIFDSSLISLQEISKNSKNIFGLPATKLANEKSLLKSANLIFLGKISQLLDLPQDLVWQQTETFLNKKIKDEAIKNKNREVFSLGYKVALEKTKFSQPDFKPKTGVINLKGAGKQGWLVPEYCKGCGICLIKCPAGAIKFGVHTGSFATPLPEIDLAKCTACGNCFLFCPDGAIKIEKNKRY